MDNNSQVLKEGNATFVHPKLIILGLFCISISLAYLALPEITNYGLFYGLGTVFGVGKFPALASIISYSVLIPAYMNSKSTKQFNIIYILIIPILLLIYSIPSTLNAISGSSYHLGLLSSSDNIYHLAQSFVLLLKRSLYSSISILIVLISILSAYIYARSNNNKKIHKFDSTKTK